MADGVGVTPDDEGIASGADAGETTPDDTQSGMGQPMGPGATTDVTGWTGVEDEETAAKEARERTERKATSGTSGTSSTAGSQARDRVAEGVWDPGSADQPAGGGVEEAER